MEESQLICWGVGSRFSWGVECILLCLGFWLTIHEFRWFTHINEIINEQLCIHMNICVYLYLYVYNIYIYPGFILELKSFG